MREQRRAAGGLINVHQGCCSARSFAPRVRERWVVQHGAVGATVEQRPSRRTRASVIFSSLRSLQYSW